MHATAKRLIPFLLVPLGLAALVVLYHYPPTEYTFYPGCTFYRATGLHCPGCGATRSLYAPLHGDVMQALAYNPLFVVMLPVLIVSGLRLVFASRWPGSKRDRRLPAWAIYTIAGTLLAFWVLRNIDVYPLNLLAPHAL